MSELFEFLFWTSPFLVTSISSLVVFVEKPIAKSITPMARSPSLIGVLASITCIPEIGSLSMVPVNISPSSAVNPSKVILLFEETL